MVVILGADGENDDSGIGRMVVARAVGGMVGWFGFGSLGVEGKEIWLWKSRAAAPRRWRAMRMPLAWPMPGNRQRMAGSVLVVSLGRTISLIVTSNATVFSMLCD